MIPEPMPSAGSEVGSEVSVPVVTIRTTAGLTLAATAMIADDSSILIGCGTLTAWPDGPDATAAGRSSAPVARSVR